MYMPVCLLLCRCAGVVSVFHANSGRGSDADRGGYGDSEVLRVAESWVVGL